MTSTLVNAARSRRPDRLARERSQNALARHFGVLVRFALCLGLMSASVHAAVPVSDVQVASLLKATAGESDSDALAERFKRLGASSLPAMFDCIRDGVYTVQTRNTKQAESLTPAQLSALLDAASGFDSSAVMPFLRKRTTDEPTLENRRTALRLIQRFARLEHLNFCMQLAEPMNATDVVDTRSEDYVTKSIEHVLSHSQSSYFSMKTLFERSHPDLKPLVVRALGNVDTESSFRTLSNLLGLTHRLDLFILTTMGRVAHNSTLPADERVLGRVREYKASTNPALICEALLILGRIEDAGSVETMIEHLGHEDTNVRKAAHWSLKRMSGLNLRAEAKRWRMWHKDEAEWWNDHSQKVFNWLRSHSVLERKRGIAVISKRHLMRHELALKLVPLLRDPEESVAAQAARALSILNSPRAIPGLREVLEHPSELVRTSAANALLALGVEDLDQA